jgi:hypothetical protein
MPDRGLAGRVRGRAVVARRPCPWRVEPINNHYLQFMAERTGGQLLVDALAHQGVRTIFGIPGVQLDNAADALYQAADRISFFCARNEQATTYMADG